MRPLALALLSALFFLACSSKVQKQNTEKVAGDYAEKDLLTNTRRLVFEGKRAGEGYFSADGRYMIYQAEVAAENPYYQIYVMDLNDGESWRVSPGHGKTTCAWIHPNGKKVLFSSTHRDKDARKKQRDELAFRASGKQRRYSWDYDENYDIYSTSIRGKGGYKRLTKTRGYDAEGSYSPDGKWIAFASNRHAFRGKLEASDKKKFSSDPSYMLDIYIMKSDGSAVKRLTSHKGYDGGPFFSPDGERIVWRRFSSNGHTAEVYSMNLDGSDKRQLTKMKAMSWAPFYHPSGDYIIYTTNVHGYSNFELYIVDRSGLMQPKRVTFTDGFDGLPVFTPDGKKLAWTKKTKSSAHIYIADWNDKKARELLGLPPAAPISASLNSDIDAGDAEKLVRFFSSRSMKGRATGSIQEKIYSEKVASYFKSFGLKPIRGHKSFVIPFDFKSGGKLENAKLNISEWGRPIKLNRDYIPLSLSQSGSFEPAETVFAGYGLRVPEGEGFEAYDSFAEIDLKDKWVLMFRFLPEKFTGKKRLYFQRYARPHFKIKAAKEMGAKGVIFISGPNSGVKNQLIPWSDQQSTAELPALSITDEVASGLIAEDLETVQTQLDEGKIVRVSTNEHKISSEINITQRQMTGHNVIGMLKVPGARSSIMVGAHGDHLGEGIEGSSFKNSEDKESIHFGADDNASGMAAVLELAHYFSRNKKGLRRNIYFSIWSGEEIGLLGSKHFAENDMKRNKVMAYMNMDMIGRVNKDKEILIQGVGSSKQWPKILQKVAWKSPLNVKMQSDPYLPTDSTTFYLNKIPGVTAFSGTHTDYHSPRDVADKINYPGLVNTAQMMSKLVKVVASRKTKIKYSAVKRKGGSSGRRSFRIYLGTLPDYNSEGVEGLKLSGVIKGGPAEKGGLKRNDVIVEFAGKPIKSIYDYMYVLEMAKPGQKLNVVVLRKGSRQNLTVIPESKH